MSARARADSPTLRPRAKIPARLDRRALEASPTPRVTDRSGAASFAAPEPFVDAVSGPFERRIDAAPPTYRRRR